MGTHCSFVKMRDACALAAALAVLLASCGETDPEVRTDGSGVAVVRAAAADTLDQAQFRVHRGHIWPAGLEHCTESAGFDFDTHYDFAADAAVVNKANGEQTIFIGREVYINAASVPGAWGLATEWLVVDQIEDDDVISALAGHFGSWYSPTGSMDEDADDTTFLREFQPLDILDELEGVASTVTASEGESIDGVGTTVYDIVLDPEKARQRQLENFDEMELPPEMTEEQLEEMREAMRSASMPDELRAWVGDDGLLRRFYVTGPINPEVGGPTGMQLDFDQYGVPVTAPPADEVTAWGDLGIEDPQTGVVNSGFWGAGSGGPSDEGCWPSYEELVDEDHGDSSSYTQAERDAVLREAMEACGFDPDTSWGDPEIENDSCFIDKMIEGLSGPG